MKTTHSLSKWQSKDPNWQAVNELAFVYYQDQTNKDKRKALYDELTKDRYTTKKVRGKEIQVRGPSLLLKKMRKVVIDKLKADLGAGITDLTQDALHYMLEKKKDPTSKLPWFRATGLLGGYFSPETIKTADSAQTMQWTSGAFNPNKGAGFETFFQVVMAKAFIDYVRKVNRDRIRDRGFEGGLVPVPSGKKKGDGLQEQTQEELAHYGAGRPKEALMHVSTFLELLTSREFQEFFGDAEEEDLTEQKAALKQLLKGQTDELRDLAMQLALVKWTGETEEDIQESLGLTTQQFTRLKEQALPLIKPFIEEWWLGQSQG